MFVDLTVRAKVLIGIALACTGYVVLMPDSSGTVEPARDANGGAAIVPRAPHVIKPAPGVRNGAVMNASLHGPDRIVKDTAAGALFSAQSWIVPPPAPPPEPPAPYQPRRRPRRRRCRSCSWAATNPMTAAPRIS